MGNDQLGLSFAHGDAIARCQVLFVKVAVARPGFSGNRDDVPKDVGNNALARRVQARYFNSPLADAPVPHEGMAVAGRRSRPEIDEIARAGYRIDVRVEARLRRARLLRVRCLYAECRRD